MGALRIQSKAVLVPAVLAFAATACAPPAPPPIDAPALFAQACARCHGADARGGLPTVVNGPRPIDLTDAAWQQARSDAEIAGAIRLGRGAMPPFDGVLTGDQIHALGAYVRTLQRR